ncbi:hypothetical protein JW905_15020 [bacterium]|nr:hypothetical protein [candidate division CSSED10-310 bacterium]
MAFESIIGHERVVRMLERTIRQHRAGHAYMLVGPEGVGKRTIALELARLFTCDRGTGCGECRSCRMAMDPFTTHADIMVLSDIRGPLWYTRNALMECIGGTGGRDSVTGVRITEQDISNAYAEMEKAELLLPPIPNRSGSDRLDAVFRNPAHVFTTESDTVPSLQRIQKAVERIPLKKELARRAADALYSDIGPGTYFRSMKIGVIRAAVQRSIAVKPYLGNHKVFILDEADKMPEEAQNCLLKTLEEPPSHAALVLVTAHPDRLVSTIRSRCRQISFSPLDDRLIAPFLATQLGVSVDRARMIASMSGGSLGYALSRDWEGYLGLRDRILERFRGIDPRRPETVFLFSDLLQEDNLDFGLEILTIWCHDLLMINNERIEQCIFTDRLDTLRDGFELYDESGLAAFKECLAAVRRLLDRNVHAGLAVEAELFRFLINHPGVTDMRT